MAAMKKSITLTTTLATELPVVGSSGTSMGPVLARLVEIIKGLGYTLLGFALLTTLWYLISKITEGGLPTPLATFQVFWELVKDPFYDYGPNDKGIGLQLISSLGRVSIGFLLGSLFAIPVGVLMGANAFCKKVFYPIVQILKPVSPLAWFPIGLVAFESASMATIFIIFITKVLIPFSLPHIITGLRLSIGVAWLVIVAGEMLSGGIGIGFFVWDSWNALSLEKVISAILIIGLVGLFLDRGFSFVEKKVTYSI
jgi:nitrate/nitrite transport system permease protein